jgi:hypothetical protein
MGCFVLFRLVAESTMEDGASIREWWYAFYNLLFPLENCRRWVAHALVPDLKLPNAFR